MLISVPRALSADVTTSVPHRRYEQLPGRPMLCTCTGHAPISSTRALRRAFARTLRATFPRTAAAPHQPFDCARPYHTKTRATSRPLHFPRRSGRSSATRGTRQPRTHVPRAKDAEEHRARGSRARHSTESCEAGHSRACELSRPTDETWEREDAIVRRDVPRIEDTATVR